MVKRLIFSVLVVFVGAFLFSCGNSFTSTEEVAVQELYDEDSSEVHVLGFNPDSLKCVEGKVKSGQFFSNLFGSLGMSAGEAYDLAQACDTVFDVKTLRVDNTYRAYYSADDRLEYMVYDRDRMHCVIFDCTEPYDLWIYEKPVTRNEKYADVTINSSLWNDMLAADVSPLLILSLSDIYAWTVDFFGLQKGDRFRVLYQETVCDGSVVSVDTVRYAVFTHGGQDFPAIMFDQQDGGNLWWNDIKLHLFNHRSQAV